MRGFASPPLPCSPAPPLPCPPSPMTDVIAVLTQNILPIFVVAFFGFVLQKWKHLDKKALSTAVLYIFSPALVFHSLVNTQLAGNEMGRLILYTIAVIFGMGLLAWLVARALKLSRSDTALLLLVVMFGNAGNYGLTLNKLRYGEDGLSLAIVYYITSTIMVYTVGMFIASAGQMAWRDALAKLLRLPPVHAVVLAMVVYNFHITVPAPIMRGVELAGQATIPLMIIVLGMQLADLHGKPTWKLTIPAVSLRLLVSPFIAVFVAGVMGLSGLGRSVSIVEVMMPTAVITMIIASEFDMNQTAVTSIVAISTLLSPFTIAVAITLLGL